MSPSRLRVFVALAALAFVLEAAPADASSRCAAHENGLGTIDFPPLCPVGFATEPGEMAMDNGLAPGSWVEAKIEIVPLSLISQVPGGSLGGMVHEFSGEVVLNLVGQGVYAGFRRRMVLPTFVARAHSGPHANWVTPQSYAVDLFELQAQLPPGDADFALLRITGGTNFGLPGPGRTALTQLPSGDWAVDSFFDVFYRIDFVGQPGGTFAGLSGSHVSAARCRMGAPARETCEVPSGGGGLADLPLVCPNGYQSRPDIVVADDGVPAGRSIRARISIVNPSLISSAPGGGLGGDIQQWNAKLVIDGWTDVGPAGTVNPVTKSFQVTLETHTGPRALGVLDPFPAELMTLQGQLSPGDADFALLRISGGTNFGMPGRGHSVLTQLPGGTWVVDSFFDITYRMDFVGQVGSPFAGMSGSNTGQERFLMGADRSPTCALPDAGGTVVPFPFQCSNGYDGGAGSLILLDGLPAATSILGRPRMVVLGAFEGPGGTLNGTTSTFGGSLELDLEGHGVFAGYARSLSIPLTGVADAAPRTPFATPQNFRTELMKLDGQIVGDPDFDLLRINAGTSYGYPSPGHTTLTRRPGDWAVDGFFDIAYRFDFIGRAGGPFTGMSGSTNWVGRWQAGMEKVVAVGPGVASAFGLSAAAPNPSPGESRLALTLARPSHVRAVVQNVAGRQLRVLTDRSLDSGEHALVWNGRTDDGIAAPPGVYFVSVRIDGAQTSRKLVLR